jgi:hypothetical protein
MVCRVLYEHPELSAGTSGHLLARVDERRFHPRRSRIGGEAVARRHAGGTQFGNRQPQLYDLGIISAETVTAGTWVFRREGSSVALLA